MCLFLLGMVLTVSPFVHGEEVCEILVGVKPGAAAPAWPPGVVEVRQIPGSDIYRLKVGLGDAAEVMTLLEKEEGVAFVEKSVKATLSGNTFVISDLRIPVMPGGVSLDDPSTATPKTYSWQGLVNSAALSDLGGGAGVVVAVIDTGVDLPNSVFSGRIWTNPGEIPDDEIDNDGNGYVDDVSGWDFGDVDNDPQDLEGHGTGVSSVVLAMAPQAAILPLKVNQGAQTSFSSGDVTEAIYYAAGAGAGSINMSLSMMGTSTAIENAVKAAYAAGCVLVAAAGNSGWDVEFPANMDEVLAVGALDDQLNLSFFSSWGQDLDLTAPGEYMEVAALGGGIDLVSGTSFSSPVVAGAAGVIRGMNPHLKVGSIMGLMREGTIDLGAPGWDPYYGSGAINGAVLVKAATPGITFPEGASFDKGSSSWVTVGFHLPPTDTSVKAFVGMVNGDAAWWLGPTGEWHSLALEPLSSLATLSICSQGVDGLLFGEGGVFPGFDMTLWPAGEYLWGAAFMNGSGQSLGPVIWSKMALN